MLERDEELATVARAAHAAVRGAGSVVLVHGEAGIGKSSLVDAVRGLLPAEGRMLVGRCDDLGTPRVLGPLRDLVGTVGGELAAALGSGTDRDRIFAALRSELDWTGHPTVLVVEDVHWADEATLDVLRYLARRVADLPAVLLLTYRDDELEPHHGLRHLLGLLAGVAGTQRLELHRLTPGAVGELSLAAAAEDGPRMDAAELYEITAGNPFFVSELLACPPGTGLPATVVDSVQGRLAGLDPPTRAAVEQLSVVPGAVDRGLIEALVPGGLPGLAAAEGHGLLTVTPYRVSFRHELTRRAISDALGHTRRTLLNARVLAHLTGGAPDVDLARVMHHAAEAGDHEAIARYGPTAARSAAAGGSHREAAAFSRLALGTSPTVPAAELAELLELNAVECYTVGVHDDEALRNQRRAVALRAGAGHAAALGSSLRWLSRVAWWCGERAEAEDAARRAVAAVRDAGDAGVLAMAYSNQSQLDMLADHLPEAVAGAQRAITLARSAGDAAVLSHALNNLGCARWKDGDPTGRALLAESLAVALEAGALEQACRAYANTAWQLLEDLDLAAAERCLTEALELADRAEFLMFWQYFSVERAMACVGRADWDGALGHAQVALGTTGPAGCAAMTVVGRVAVRTGRPPLVPLQQAWATAQRHGELQRIGPAASVLCEDAWLRGDLATVRRVAAPVFAAAARSHVHALSGEMALWLRRAGETVEPRPRPGLPEHPYTLQAAGRWREAAEVWAATGHPYERAAALADSPSADDRREAVRCLDELGAPPLADHLRRQLRSEGVPTPRGPVSVTKGNPARLTGRQLEVLRLLAEGLTNAEIADRLVTSVRTVDNHVAAVLDKLDVHDRRAAVVRARELGVVPVRSR